jgi:cell wall assembly regulator SMI1
MGGVPLMKAVWKRIHAWLDANVPEGYGHLRPGATTKAIQATEKAMRLKLPADVKASYRIHDGQGEEPGLMGGEEWCLLSLQEMVKTWRRWSQSDSRFAHFVPVASGGAGDYIFLDLAPDAAKPGCLIVQRRDRDAPDPVAPSFRSWVEDFADKLDEDEFAYSEDDGCIMYADEIDLD